jgi:uncharacterized membrane protein
MNKSLWIASAVAAAVAVPIVSVGASPVAQPPKSEKCYGIVKAGKNDCQTAANSCAGSVTAEHKPDAWIYLPTGLCAKISGASLTPPQLKKP